MQIDMTTRHRPRSARSNDPFGLLTLGIAWALSLAVGCGRGGERFIEPPDAGALDAGAGDAGNGGSCPEAVADSQALGPCADGAVPDGGPFATTNTCPTNQICKVDQQCAVPYYTVNGDGTVTDTATGLTWQQMVPTNPCPQDGAPFCTWADAQSYCASLSLSGGCWRLPALDELFSLYVVSQPMNIDESTFPMPRDPPGLGYDVFWTNSLYTYDGNAFIIAFGLGGGGIDANEPGTTAAVRCVR